jgi:DUSP domain
MKTQLSSILPVWQACKVLGAETVERIVTSLVRLREAASPNMRKIPLDELTTLIQALFFNETLAALTNTTNNNNNNEPSVPPHIATAWKRWSTSKALQLDKQTILPFLVPQVIQPTSGGGHMGLFECIIYALQGSTPYTASTASILLPDVLIFLAVGASHRDRNHNKNNIHTAAVLGEQEGAAAAITTQTAAANKKIVWRMSQLSFRIYDSYMRKGVVSRDTVQRFLTDVYGEATMKQESGLLDRIFEDSDKNTIVTEQQFCIGCSVEGSGEEELLLDWLSDLVHALLPLPKLPPSTEDYLEQMHSTRPPNLYGLKDTYEIKRRFHSLVQTASVIHGDPMRSTMDRPSVAVITKEAFCRAVCTPNNEMGSGGYLPESVASRIFGDDPWNLMKLLTFGGTAVRMEDDTALIRFIFDKFSEANIIWRSSAKILIVSLLQHARFRDTADRPPSFDEMDDENAGDDVSFPLCLAVDLGLMEPQSTSRPTDLVAVDDLVQIAMQDKDHWEFKDFKEWNDRTGDTVLGGLGPLMLELKLIAAVQFGIPPLHEFPLIGEINRRHSRRYPQTEVARRGPRGTIWYIIDVGWLKEWSASVSDPKPNKKHLPKIINTNLLVENGSLQLRPEIRWRLEYDLLPPLAWSALSAWYDGGPPIQRSVVKYTPSRSHDRSPQLATEYEIEMYPYFVSIYLSDTASGGEARPFQQNYQLSRVSPVFNVLVNLCKELDIDNPDSSARIWVLEDDGNDWVLELEKSIFDQRKR